MGPVGFMKNVETASRKKPSKLVLAEKRRLVQQAQAQAQAKAQAAKV